MITNRVGPPVRGADFYGREAFVNLASDKLKAGHVLLAAPLRFGKTSVMYRLIDDPQLDYRIVHADLEHLKLSPEVRGIVEGVPSGAKIDQLIALSIPTPEGTLKIRCRPRVTQYGGATKTAV